MNDRDMTAKAFDDFENMRCEKNGHTALGHACEQRFQRARGKRVDTFERFVEKQNARPMDHRGRESYFFLHAVRIIGDHRFRADRRAA